jgi:hypothetical protein
MINVTIAKAKRIMCFLLILPSVMNCYYDIKSY